MRTTERFSVTPMVDQEEASTFLDAERRLLISVLIQALHDLTSSVATYKKEALAWLESRDCERWCELCEVRYAQVTTYLARYRAGNGKAAIRRWRGHG
jgi:hypothetical protein